MKSLYLVLKTIDLILCAGYKPENSAYLPCKGYLPYGLENNKPARKKRVYLCSNLIAKNSV